MWPRPRTGFPMLQTKKETTFTSTAANRKLGFPTGTECLIKKIFRVGSNRKRLPQRVGFEPVRADKVVARSMPLETLKRRPGRFEPLHANWCPQLK